MLTPVRHWFRNDGALVPVQVDELPSDLVPDTLYYVPGEGKYLRALAMQCPCGCRDSIHLTFLRPWCRWTHHTDGTMSLHPAIWHEKGCGSYLFIRRGRVFRWNGGTGDQHPFSTNLAAESLQQSAE